MRSLFGCVIQIFVGICFIYLLTFTTSIWKLVGVLFQFIVEFAYLVVVEGDTETKVFYAGIVVFLYGLGRMKRN